MEIIDNHDYSIWITKKILIEEKKRQKNNTIYNNPHILYEISIMCCRSRCSCTILLHKPGAAICHKDGNKTHTKRI